MARAVRGLPDVPVMLGLVVSGLAVWIAWLPFGGTARRAAALYLGFVLADGLLLWTLPRLELSFGPVAPQCAALAVPRFSVAVAAAAAALLLRWRARRLPSTRRASSLLGPLFTVQLAGSLAYTWGLAYEPFALATTHVEARAAAWSSDATPLRIVHLSDIHVERLTRREAALLREVERAQPDLIVLTGDYLNLSYVRDPIAQAHARELLSSLRARYGVYAVSGAPPVDPPDVLPSIIRGTGIRLLRNEVAEVRLANGRRLSLLGVTCRHDAERDAEALRALLPQAPADGPRVLLYHSPDLMPAAAALGLDAYFCGHTHGGQVRLPLYGALITSSALGKRYEAGLYREGQTLLYVSRGIGLEGGFAPRLRLLCRPEVVVCDVAGAAAAGVDGQATR